MKEYYKIGEISSLYNIGTDSLRYYEKIGILSPKRNNNGYRVYSIRDIWKLNVIRDLRKLNFSMKKIKEYLNHRDLISTKEVFMEELVLIDEKINSLIKIKENIKRRISTVDEGLNSNDIDEIRIKHIDERRALQIEKNISRDEEVDFLLKKLNEDKEDKLYLLGNSSMGTTIPLEYAKNKIYNKYNSVFIELNKAEKNYDFLLHEGEYVYVCYRGDYKNNTIWIPKMLEYINSKGYTIDSEIIEICKIDIHETSKTEEFLTELQIKVNM